MLNDSRDFAYFTARFNDSYTKYPYRQSQMKVRSVSHCFTALNISFAFSGTTSVSVISRYSNQNEFFTSSTKHSNAGHLKKFPLTSKCFNLANILAGCNEQNRE